MADIEEARARMIAKRFGGNATGASTGGGGSVRRKKKAAHKTAGGGNNLIFHNLFCFINYIFKDDKKLKTTLKKLGVQPIPGIEEANLFRDTGDVIHFVNPKCTYHFVHFIFSLMIYFNMYLI
jgi:hypothetical protein